jgi:hypothetical protein
VPKSIARIAVGAKESFPTLNIKISVSRANNVTKNTSSISTINNFSKKRPCTLQPLISYSANMKKQKPNTTKSKRKSTNTNNKNARRKSSKAISKRQS